MKILIMRHGEAEATAKDDESRQLTEYGKRQSFTQGEWLKIHLKKQNISLQKVVVSPYIRAQETFNQVNLAMDNQLVDKIEIWNEITPYGSASGVVDYLSVLQQDGIKSILFISHLPLVGEMVAELYGNRNPVSFYPATIAQLDWDRKNGKLESYCCPS